MYKDELFIIEILKYLDILITATQDKTFIIIVEFGYNIFV